MGELSLFERNRQRGNSRASDLGEEDGAKGDEIAKGVLGALPSLIGLAGGLATAIPGLKKPQQSRAGEIAANRTAGAASRAAVGGSQTGFGATRGLNLRTGLRQGAEIAERGAGVAATRAVQDRRFNIEQTERRNSRLAEFGMDAADMAANFGQSVVEAKAAKEVELAEKAEALAQLPDVPKYDLGGGPTVDPYTQTIQEGREGLQRLQQTAAEYPPASDFPRQEQGGAPLPPPPSIDPLDVLLGIPDKATIYRAAPELQLQHSLENLALQEAERQGIPLERVYARLQRLQNLPAIRLLQERLELEEEFQGF
jgi:hypothetical protein